MFINIFLGRDFEICTMDIMLPEAIARKGPLVTPTHIIYATFMFIATALYLAATLVPGWFGINQKIYDRTDTVSRHILWMLVTCTVSSFVSGILGLFADGVIHAFMALVPCFTSVCIYVALTEVDSAQAYFSHGVSFWLHGAASIITTLMVILSFIIAHIRDTRTRFPSAHQKPYPFTARAIPSTSYTKEIMLSNIPGIYFPLSFLSDYNTPKTEKIHNQ